LEALCRGKEVLCWKFKAKQKSIMLVKTYNQTGEEAGKTKLPKDIFEVEVNPDLVYQVVTAQIANQRQRIAHTKNRAEVRGGGRKPWRQKGTGRARHGSTRSPIWRHGGVAFGPRKEKVFEKKINKKMKRKALYMVLSAKAQNNLLYVLDNLDIPEIKTKYVVEILNNLRGKIENLKSGTILIALPSYDRKLVLAARNIPGVKTLEASKLNSLDLLSSKFLLLLKESIVAIKDTFSETEKTETK